MFFMLLASQEIKVQRFCSDYEKLPRLNIIVNVYVLKTTTYLISHYFQSIQSSCENEPIDLNGLHESVVDSDEDLTDSMDVSSPC